MISADCSKIKVCVFDIDGTMTDGRLAILDATGRALKFFHIKDGLGLGLLRRAGLKLCVLTGRADACNRKRCEDLKFDVILDDCIHKGQGMQRICQMLQVTPAECFYMGDDLIDLPAIRLAGIAAAPADAVAEVRAEVDFVAPHPAGMGAVRDACEWLLKAQGKWEQILEEYVRDRI